MKRIRSLVILALLLGLSGAPTQLPAAGRSSKSAANASAEAKARRPANRAKRGVKMRRQPQRQRDYDRVIEEVRRGGASEHFKALANAARNANSRLRNGRLSRKERKAARTQLERFRMLTEQLDNRVEALRDASGNTATVAARIVANLRAPVPDTKLLNEISFYMDNCPRGSFGHRFAAVTRLRVARATDGGASLLNDLVTASGVVDSRKLANLNVALTSTNPNGSMRGFARTSSPGRGSWTR